MYRSHLSEKKGGQFFLHAHGKREKKKDTGKWKKKATYARHKRYEAGILLLLLQNASYSINGSAIIRTVNLCHTYVTFFWTPFIATRTYKITRYTQKKKRSCFYHSVSLLVNSRHFSVRLRTCIFLFTLRVSRRNVKKWDILHIFFRV